MGTNYYAHIVPSKEKRDHLKKLIDTNDNFIAILDEATNLYGNFRMDYGGNESGGRVHLGKASRGWSFLWNPNAQFVRHWHMEEEKDKDGRIIHRPIDDPNTLKFLYPLTKEGVKAFIDREDVIIIDEYGEIQDKEEFWDYALHFGEELDRKPWDHGSYEEWEKKHNPNYTPWRETSELAHTFEQYGYKFTSPSKSDFYSDGLRFATCTEFC